MLVDEILLERVHTPEHLADLPARLAHPLVAVQVERIAVSDEERQVRLRSVGIVTPEQF